MKKIFHFPNLNFKRKFFFKSRLVFTTHWVLLLFSLAIIPLGFLEKVNSNKLISNHAFLKFPVSDISFVPSHRVSSNLDWSNNLLMDENDDDDPIFLFHFQEFIDPASHSVLDSNSNLFPPSTLINSPRSPPNLG